MPKPIRSNKESFLTLHNVRKQNKKLKKYITKVSDDLTRFDMFPSFCPSCKRTVLGECDECDMCKNVCHYDEEEKCLTECVGGPFSSKKLCEKCMKRVGYKCDAEGTCRLNRTFEQGKEYVFKCIEKYGLILEKSCHIYKIVDTGKGYELTEEKKDIWEYNL